MNTTVFNKKDGSVSSIRVGSSNMKSTAYLGKSYGGVTFKNDGFTSRINNKGQTIALGIKCGNHTTYFGKNGSVSKKLTGFDD